MTPEYERWRREQARASTERAGARILLVDDEPDVLRGLRLSLRSYETTTARGGREALVTIEGEGPFALVISDMRMPGMDGATFLGLARDADPDMVRVLLTGNAGVDAAIAAVNEGQIFRFLTKPCPPARLLAAVEASLAEHARRRGDRALVDQALAGSVRALARAVDAKDDETQAHSRRVARLSAMLAQALGWSLERGAALFEAALVHDVGKIGVPDEILRKPGRLTAEEYERVKRHTVLGEEIVREILSPEQVTWVRSHHERFDGRGYPDGLAGEAIPEGARVLAVADSLDVMTSERVYKRSKEWVAAVEECRREAGGQFCPAAVDALVDLWRAGLLPPAPVPVPEEDPR